MSTSSSPLRPKTTTLPIVSESPTNSAIVRRKPKPIFRLLRYLLLLIALFLLYKFAAIGYYGWRIYQAAQTLQSVAANQADMSQIAALQPTIRSLSNGIAGVEREMRIATPLLRRLGAVPKAGTLLVNSPELLVAGKELTAILDEMMTVVGPALAAKKPLVGEDSVATSLSNAKAQFATMEQHAVVASVALKNTDLAGLHPKLAANNDLIQTLLRAMPAVFQIAPSLPTLIGSEKSQTYLILVQNNHELRATGGFITAVGRVKLDYGEISELDFSDSYTVYVEGHNYPKAPAAQEKYMRIPILLFRDANWSPDLPTSAQTLKAIYYQDTQVAVDGIITVDINAVTTIVDALGKLTLEGSEEPITGANIVDFLKQLWAQPLNSEGTVQAENFDIEWWKRRKDFVPALAKAILQRVQSGDFDKLALVNAALHSLDQRFVQVWVNDKDAAKALAWQGWDGGLEPESASDFLALVDTNMGYNKVDSVLSRRLDYKVVWSEGNQGPAQATVTIVYEHPFAVPSEEKCDNTPRYGNSYDEMTERCYFDYVRLYTPTGSKLIKAEGFADTTVETLRGEKGTQIFAGYFIMKPGTQHVVRFTYTLPPAIHVDGYHLRVQKQSGIATLPLTIEVNSRQAALELSNGTLDWALQEKQAK